jgi:hypothetical protein
MLRAFLLAWEGYITSLMWPTRMLAARVRAGVFLLGASGLLREGPSQQTGVRGETGELVRVFATLNTLNDIIRGPRGENS